MRLILLLLLAICATFPQTIAVADDIASDNDTTSRINYTVDLSDAENHYAAVTMKAVATENETELMMAVWTPGSYLVREYARHLDSLAIVDADGNAHDFKKTRKNRWLVRTKPGEAFTVSYRLYCNEVSVRTNFIGHRYAVLNGAPTFVTIPDQMDQPHHVALTMPTGSSDWEKSATSLLPGSTAHTYIAKTFDELVDSPIVAGLIDAYPLNIDGARHQLVNVGESGYWDGAKAAKDLALIVRQHQAMWGTVPYDRYLFINVIAEGRGGLEHDNCCLMLASRWAFRVDEKYQDWLSLSSHEFFHTWNVRRLRPKPLMKYDYENEIYTDSLWIAEGVTNYYEDVMLARAGLIDHDEYLKRLSKNIETVQTNHGRKVQSLRDASFDTWIKFYRPDENSSNTRVSYYSKGTLVAFLLDAHIRKLTANQKSLDDVMRQMWTRFHATGYTQAEFRQTASQVAGDDLSDWFKHAIDSTNELDYETALDWYGLQFEEEDADDDQESADSAKPKEDAAKEDAAKEDEKPKPWLGFKLDGDKITGVKPESPATAAGINTGDELLGIEGFQLHESLDDHLEQFKIGDKIELLVSRNGQLLKRSLTIAAAPEEKWSLAFVEEPSDQQSTNRDTWLPKPQNEAVQKTDRK